jgi:formylglycine-generating enzyme required for sulfatase activity
MTSQRTAAATLALLLACSGPLAAQDAAALKTLEAKEWTLPELGLQLKRIPAGTFTMGSPKTEANRREDETQHEVTITKPFYMGAYEVRQKEFYDIMLPGFDHESWQYWRGPLHAGAAYNYRGGGGKLRLDYPMECVTWQRAVTFCEKITAREKKAGRLPKGYVYRLPTEAEWEYACRAGARGPYNVKGDPKSKDFLKTFAHCAAGESTAVGRKKPNAWGLYDMHGNVYEWCLDWYGPYPAGKVADPAGPAKGRKRVGRGGCWTGGTGPFLRSASRYRFDPRVNFYAILGFRVVLAPAILPAEK